MSNELIRVGASLPSVPVLLPDLDGENLEKTVLLLRPGLQSAEQAIAKYRRENAAEACPHYRRYYLKPHMRGGRATGRYSIRYAYDLNQPHTDRTVGTFQGDDIVAACIVLGNQISGAWMTSIRWELCEDREGMEPITMGRFDAWSLLKEATQADIERLAERDITPDVEGWMKFDGHYIERGCPRCHTKTSINIYAFSIDSAKCANCGIRPFLSRDLVRRLSDSLPSVTGGSLRRPDETLAHAIGWMSDVGASTDELHQEELPDGLTPHQVLVNLAMDSRLIPDFSSAQPLVSSASAELLRVIDQGGPFTEAHEHMIKMLKAMRRN